MGLVTIEGKLYLPMDEFVFLVSVRELNRIDDSQAELLSNEEIDALMGYDHSSYRGVSWIGMQAWPDWCLIRSVRRRCRPAAYIGYYTEPGEEDISGRVYGSKEYPIEHNPITGEYWLRSLADISMIGPASLVGKIALELCRRLEEELDADQEALDRAIWEPPE